MAKKPVKAQHDNDEAERELREAEEREAEEREQEGQHPEDRGPPVRQASQPRRAPRPAQEQGQHPLGSRNGTGGQHGQQDREA